MNINQKTLNEVAQAFLHDQSFEVFKKLQKAMLDDYEERSKQVRAGQVLHHVHCMSLFECLMWLNLGPLLGEDVSQEALDEYLSFVETLRPKYLDLVDAFKDFQPAE